MSEKLTIISLSGFRRLKPGRYGDGLDGYQRQAVFDAIEEIKDQLDKFSIPHDSIMFLPDGDIAVEDNLDDFINWIRVDEKHWAGRRTIRLNELWQKCLEFTDIEATDKLVEVKYAGYEYRDLLWIRNRLKGDGITDLKASFDHVTTVLTIKPKSQSPSVREEIVALIKQAIKGGDMEFVPFPDHIKTPTVRMYLSGLKHSYPNYKIKVTHLHDKDGLFVTKSGESVTKSTENVFQTPVIDRILELAGGMSDQDLVAFEDALLNVVDFYRADTAEPVLTEIQKISDQVNDFLAAADEAGELEE